MKMPRAPDSLVRDGRRTLRIGRRERTPRRLRRPAGHLLAESQRRPPISTRDADRPHRLGEPPPWHGGRAGLRRISPPAGSPRRRSLARCATDAEWAAPARRPSEPAEALTPVFAALPAIEHLRRRRPLPVHVDDEMRVVGEQRLLALGVTSIGATAQVNSALPLTTSALPICRRTSSVTKAASPARSFASNAAKIASCGSSTEPRACPRTRVRSSGRDVVELSVRPTPRAGPGSPSPTGSNRTGRGAGERAVSVSISRGDHRAERSLHRLDGIELTLPCCNVFRRLRVQGCEPRPR